MATITHPEGSYFDLRNREGIPEANMVLAEYLAKSTPIMGMMPHFPASHGNIHKVLFRTGLPTITWTALHEGVPQSKGSTQTLDYTAGRCEGQFEYDPRADEEGNNVSEGLARWKNDQMSGFMQSFGHEMANAYFYSNEEVNPKKITGLATHYNTIAHENVIDGGGTGTDNRSIYLLHFGSDGIHAFYPNTAPMGLVMQHYENVPRLDSDNNTWFADVTNFRQYTGLAVKDWRAGCRIANIDASLLSDDASTGADLIKLMKSAYNSIHPSMMHMPGAWFMSKDVMETLDNQMNSKISNSTLGKADFMGRDIDTFKGLPIFREDTLKGDEARVT